MNKLKHTEEDHRPLWLEVLLFPCKIIVIISLFLCVFSMTLINQIVYKVKEHRKNG